MKTPRARLPIARWDLWIACGAVAFGAYLRLDRIAAQVLADDEWHALVFMKDHGYGAIDFYAVDEHLGDVMTFGELVDAAHPHGIKIIQDQVVNHTGPLHPWVADRWTTLS